MLYRFIITLGLLLFATISALGESKDENESDYGIKFGGFVKNDVFYDTRQTIAPRDGHFHLFPAGIKKDENGKDINATPNFSMLAIQTRLTGRITGPDAFGAKTGGIIEGEFFGSSDRDVNGFRLRHAFVKLEWENSELLSGNFWHPLFTVQAFPEVLSFNTGVPFKPFSRNPQVRYTYKFNNGINIIGTLYTLREFPASGPAKTNEEITYERNPGYPNINISFNYTLSDNQSIFGAGLDYKTIMPEMVTDLNHKTNTSIGSYSATAYGKFVFSNITVKLQALYAQNAFNIMGIGGYAVKYNTYNEATGERKYSNINTGSFWTEVYYRKNALTAGIFAGYTQNLGSDNKIDTDFIFARGSNIEYICRVSPRLAFTNGNTTIGTELEFTTAAYGNSENIDNKGRVTNSEDLNNIRFLLSFIYNF